MKANDVVKKLALVAYVVALSACATGQYQWVDVRGQGQGMFNVANSECSTHVRSRPVASAADIEDQQRSQFIKENSDISLNALSARAGVSMGRGINAMLGRELPEVSDAKGAYMACMSRFGFQQQYVTQ
ncbi:MAG: hypothetical protein IPM01_27020 [Burkholderiaceae bacterium]|nr:hypothetical protein [Burkholderiaceae bacterium]